MAIGLSHGLYEHSNASARVYSYNSMEVGKNVVGNACLGILSGNYRPSWLGLLRLFQQHLFLRLLSFEMTCISPLPLSRAPRNWS